MPPSILSATNHLSIEEKIELYTTYLETRFREITLKPLSPRSRKMAYLSEAICYKTFIEKDLEYFYKMFGTTITDYFQHYKESNFIELRMAKLTECSNEFKFLPYKVKYILRLEDNKYKLDEQIVK